MSEAMDTKWLIYSIEHSAWWKPDYRGYTRLMHEAGRYTQLESVKIVSDANRGCSPDSLQEFMVLAPESIDALEAENEKLRAELAAKTCPRCDVDGYWYRATKIQEELVANLREAIRGAALKESGGGA